MLIIRETSYSSSHARNSSVLMSERTSRVAVVKYPREKGCGQVETAQGVGVRTENFCGGNQTLEVWKNQNNQRLMRGNDVI